MEKKHATNERKIHNHLRRFLDSCRKSKKYARTSTLSTWRKKIHERCLFSGQREKKHVARLPRGITRRRGLKTINHRRWMLYYVGRYYIDSSMVPDVALLMPDYDRGFAASTSICCTFFTLEINNIMQFCCVQDSSHKRRLRVAILPTIKYPGCPGVASYLSYYR